MSPKTKTSRSVTKPAAGKARSRSKNKGGGKRLRPGELDGIVLAYMRSHRDTLPLTATAIGNGINRSSGAVANCLVRLTKGGQMRQAKRNRGPTR